MSICEAAGLGVSVDTAPYLLVGDTAHCHVAATASGHYPVDCDGHLTFYRVPEGTFKGGVRFDGGMAGLPDGPGLGVDADCKKLARIAVQKAEDTVWASLSRDPS